MTLGARLLALESRPLGWLRVGAAAVAARARRRRARLDVRRLRHHGLFDGADGRDRRVRHLEDDRRRARIADARWRRRSAASLFGTIADRHGRRTGIISSVLTYSLFTAACGLAQTVWQLAIFRFVLGLGMGGAWTTGAALVSESWPDRHRGKAIGLMQSAWAIGYGAAALLSAIVLPRYGWRRDVLDRRAAGAVVRSGSIDRSTNRRSGRHSRRSGTRAARSASIFTRALSPSDHRR